MTYVEPLAAPAPKVSMLPPELSLDGVSDFSIKLGAEFPNFECNTTKGNFMFHDFLEQGKEKWTCLMSHPKDFTPVCTTELGMCHKMVKEFKKRGVKLIGLSCDTVEEHKAWSRDVLALASEGGRELAFPIIAE